METHKAAAGGGDEQQICRRNDVKGGRCKNTCGDNKLHYCDFHYKAFTDFVANNPCSVTSNKSKRLIEKKKRNMEKKNLPPDEQRCSHAAGNWRCKNFRMGHDDDSLPQSRQCEKHYNYRANYYKNLKKRNGDGLCASTSATGTETRDRQRRKKVPEKDDCYFYVTGIQSTTADTIGADGSANFGRNTNILERTEGCGEVESLTGIRDSMVELEYYKSMCSELSVELDKRKLECIRNTAATDYWKNRCSDLESRVLMVENENSAIGCVISSLESLIPRRNEMESSTLRCSRLRNSEMIESEDLGLQNEVTQDGEKHNISKPNAETSIRGRKNSCVFELKTGEHLLNMHGIGINKHQESMSEIHNYYAANNSSGSPRLSSRGEKVKERNGWGCSEEIPSQHGPSSQDHSEFSMKTLVNLVSDDSGECLDESEDSDSCTDSEGSLGNLMDMNTSKDKWKCQADMLCSLEEEPNLCMKAVCALYRQHISKEEISANGLFHYSDEHRGTTLAKFLMDGDCKGQLQKSVEELEEFDSKGVQDCKRLATSYSKQLFDIYQNGQDPFFASSTASLGNQTSV